jgi:hypothetical protein
LVSVDGDARSSGDHRAVTRDEDHPLALVARPEEPAMVAPRSRSARLSWKWPLACALTAGAVLAGVSTAGASPTDPRPGSAPEEAARAEACDSSRTAPGEASSSGAKHSGRARHRCARAGELLDITLRDLRPTQAVLGHDEIYYKLGRYASDKDEQAGGVNKRFDDWCETNGQEKAETVSPDARLTDPSSFTCTVPVGEETPDTLAEMKTAVIGPGGVPYLTDGHHTMTAFQESPDGGSRMRIRVRVVDNLSELPVKEFWRKMRDDKRVWLRDENNEPITVGELPKRVGLTQFRDDRYRGLVYFTRDIGYEVPEDAPEFLEFSWGSWLRQSIDLRDHDLNDAAEYLDLVEQASKAMVALDGDHVVDDGATAAQLGRMAEWNDGKSDSKGEFGDLGKPITDPEPGKLAYALDYRSGD